MAYKIIQNHLSLIIDQINIYNKHSKNKLYKKYSDKYQKELWIIFLYFSQIELIKNIKQLLSVKNPISVPILVRSSIDILVLMSICNKDFSNLLSHYKHHVTEDIKDFKKYLNNTDLTKLTREQLIQTIQYLDSNNLAIHELEDVKKIKLHEKAKREHAEISIELELLYKTLSDHTHHGYDSLVGRSGIGVAGKYMASKTKVIDKFFIYFCIVGLLQCLSLSMVELIKCIRLPGNHNLGKLIDEIHKLKKILNSKLTAEKLLNT